MLISLDMSGGHEDVLRALGAVLDERGARAIILSDVTAGLLVRARMPSQILQLMGRLLDPIERVFTSRALLEAQVQAVMRRGSGHVAGPLERSLRVVGRQIDERKLEAVTAIQGDVDGEWSVWHDRIGDGRAEVVRLTDDDIRAYDSAGVLDRRERAASGR